MLDVLEAGGEELRIEEDLYEVFTEPEHFEEVKTALESKYLISSAEVTMLPIPMQKPMIRLLRSWKH